MIINGNALHLPLADESVQCVVTSPPYWGLRDYGTARWEGGDPECDHIQTRNLKRDTNGGMLPAWQGTRGTQSSTASSAIGYRDVCGKCGAIRIDAQLGLEATPEEYVANMVAVFREVRRVLRDDGTVWLNIGDSYASGKGTCYNPGGGETSLGQERKAAGAHPLDRGNKSTLAAVGLKPKDLVGIPWRVAFALQADGWWLRSDIIWAKPNPMPESVKDRCTRSHEYVFMLTKSARYYYDAEAIAEPSVEPVRRREKRNGESAVDTKRRGHDANCGNSGRRNKRDVWSITTKPFQGAHFATMPTDLVEPCIKAGTSERGCCPECGAPWERVTEVTGQTKQKWGTAVHPEYATGPMDRGGNSQMETGGIATGMINTRVTTGWRPTCACDAGEPVPCVVLDPFAGAGTVGLVASRLGRRHIGVELSLEYCQMAEQRIYDDAPLLAGVAL